MNEQEQPTPAVPCIYVTGNVADGFAFTGPYPSFDVALEVHKDDGDDTGFVVELYPPALPNGDSTE